MKTKFFATIALVLAICLNSFAQEAEINWSEKIAVDGKKTGFMESIVGEKDELIFIEYTNSTNSKASYRLASYNKESLREINSVDVAGFTKSASSAKDPYDNMTHYKTVVLDEVIYVFWKKKVSKTVDELYAESFDLQLNQAFPLVQVLRTSTDVKHGDGTTMFVVANRNAKSKILVGIERPEGEENDVFLDYKILNEDLSFSDSNSIPLGYKWGKKKDKYITSGYTLLDNNNLIVRSSISYEYELKGKSRTGTYIALTCLNLMTNEIKSHSFRDQNYRYREITTISTPNGIRLAGFYSDLNEDPDGSRLHGFFVAAIDDNNNLSDIIRNEFNAEFLTDLYPKKNTENMSDRKKKKEEAKEEGALSSLEIEQFEVTSNGIVLFLTQENNYTVTTCDSKGHCTTRYYCKKTDVYTFAVDFNFNYQWHNTITRSITYGGWNVADIVVKPIKEGFFVTYGDVVMDQSETGAKKAKKKSSDQLREMLEYAIVTNKGASSKHNMRINQPNTAKDQKKFVSAAGSFHRVGDELYVFSSNLKLKFGFWPVCCCSMGLAQFKMKNYQYGHCELGKLIIE